MSFITSVLLFRAGVLLCGGQELDGYIILFAFCCAMSYPWCFLTQLWSDDPKWEQEQLVLRLMKISIVTCVTCSSMRTPLLDLMETSIIMSELEAAKHLANTTHSHKDTIYLSLPEILPN